MVGWRGEGSKQSPSIVISITYIFLLFSFYYDASSEVAACCWKRFSFKANNSSVAFSNPDLKRQKLSGYQLKMETLTFQASLTWGNIMDEGLVSWTFDTSTDVMMGMKSLVF